MPRSIFALLSECRPAMMVIVALAPFGWIGTAVANTGPQIFWDNGPIVNCPGSGAGGADASRLQDASLMMGTYGFGFQHGTGYWIADDFTVTQTTPLGSILLFGYQTNSPASPSPIEALYIKVYNGDPRTTGQVIWGDDTTNRLVCTVWSGIYRDAEMAPLATNRPVMFIYAEADQFPLPPGTYWLACSAAGSTLYTGPWMPPITISGQVATGNAIQFLGASWQPLVDGSTGEPQGIPFILSTGSEGACCLPSGACFSTSSASCTALGGVLWIPGGSCVPNPCPTSGVEAETIGAPSLQIQAIPSPSTGGTLIRYRLPRAGSATVEIFDAGGAVVRRFTEAAQAGGAHAIRWDGRDARGNDLRSGVYQLRIEAAGEVALGRLIIVR